MARILYLSCHAVLEKSAVSLLHELGHEVFSPGAYIDPGNPGENSLRPGISGLQYDSDIEEQWHRLAASHPGEDGKDYLTKEFVNNFEIVLVMHMPRWITRNWEAVKHKRVIWRTIGQSISNTEAELKPYRQQGMEIVRYSPMERNIPGYIGEDALIRFCKDPEEYKDWTGHIPRVVTFAQHMKQRDTACNFSLFEAVTRGFPRHLFGPGNENVGDWTSGAVPFEQLKQEMRDNRIFFYTGTHPASYTLGFIEAFLTGIPIVAIGSKRGNANYFPGHNLYEIPQLIQNHLTGFVSDDPNELRMFIQLLLENHDIAKVISKQAREQAVKIFGKKTIRQQWQEYLF